MKPDTVFTASLETRNFSFSAVAFSSLEARLALVDGLHKHASQYDLPDDWFEESMEDIEVLEQAIEKPYRDGEPIK